MIDVKHWQDAEADGQWHWGKYFSAKEIADRKTDQLRISCRFMDWLYTLRVHFDKPMIISSGYRTPEHEFDIDGRRTGAHVDGEAVDVLITGPDAFKLVELAIKAGVAGLGISQRGDEVKRFIHLDRWTKRKHRVIWSY